MLGTELALGDGGAGEPFGLQLSGADSLTRGAGTERSFLAVAAEPRMVSRQIAEAVVNMREGSVELRLSPEELGRVSLSMSQGEGGMLVHLAAERPETLELLRRHIALLETELGAMGFEAAGFSFGAAGQDGGSQGVEGQLAENADPAGAPLEQLGETIARDTSSPLSGASDARLDIRV
ncbi:MAG: flagellar hook-length control protein FliK [Mangrovicoccus sp.]|nr:flagellar hook-length control protein FliK [Mangrovicoccus sp.]